MIITKETMNNIVYEVKLLDDVDDCVGVEIGNNKGLFVQVVNYGNEKEYLIELNDIEEGNVYEPCKEYNAFAKFGDIDDLIKSIENYLA